MGLLIEAGGEVQGIWVADRRICLSEDDLPQPGIGDDIAAGIGELAEEIVAGGIVDVDDAVAEIADQQIAAKLSEARGSQSHAPGSVEIAAGDGALDELALDAAYTLAFGMPILALMEAFRMIEAGFANTGNSAWMRKNGPRILMPTVRSKAASSHCSKGLSSAMPALTKRTSRFSKCILMLAARS